MLDGENMLKNKAGVWKPVKVDLPIGENEGMITNKIDDKVLTVIKDEVVWQEYSDGNDTNQIWTRGVPFSESLQSENCFTLQNPDSGLYLTATGGDTLEIQGKMMIQGAKEWPCLFLSLKTTIFHVLIFSQN